MKYLIEVTENNIKYGIAQNCYLCPVARAICLKLRIPISSQRVAVGIREIYIKKTLKTPEIELTISKLLSRRIAKFDKGEKIKPFKFWLKLPD